MFTRSMHLDQLLAAYTQARELSRLQGNHGKKIRLALEALLRDGISISADKSHPMVFAGQVDQARIACGGAFSPYWEDEASEFGLTLVIDTVDLRSFSMRLRVSVTQEPQTMRARQQLLEQIATRLDRVHSMLQFSAPSDRVDVLPGLDPTDMDPEARDREFERLTGMFERLLDHDFRVLEDPTFAIGLAELASAIDPAVSTAVSVAARSART